MNSNCGKATVGLKYNNMLTIAGNNPLSLHANAPQSLTWCGCHLKRPECADMLGTSACSLTMWPCLLTLRFQRRSPAPWLGLGLPPFHGTRSTRRPGTTTWADYQHLITSSSTQFFAEWAQHWEAALDGCVQDQPDGHLPHTFRGRAKCTQSMKASLTSPVSKPSRQGEVTASIGSCFHPSPAAVQAGAEAPELQACCCRQQADAGCWGLQTHLVVRHQERTWIWWIFPRMVASEKNTFAFSPCNFSTCTSWWIHCWANLLGL